MRKESASFLSLDMPAPHSVTFFPVCFIMAALFMAEKANENKGGLMIHKRKARA